MMNLEGAKSGKRDDEKSTEGGYHRLSHHLHHLTNYNKSIIWMMVFVVVADIILILCVSAYNNHPSLATSQDSKHPFPSQYFSSGQANISSITQDDSSVEGDLSSTKSNISSLTHDDSSVEGDLSSPKSNISSQTHDDSTAESDLSSPSFSSVDDSSKGNQSSPIESVREIQSSQSPTDTVQGNAPSPVNQDTEETKLERVLNKAANANKTVIFTTVNAAWTKPGSLFDLFLEGFRIGNQTQYLLNHLVVVAVDQKAYSRCLELNLHCFALSTEGVDFSGKANYMSSQYLKMMWRRLDFMRTVLELGYSFIFTDTDIVWFRDPFPHFYSDADFQIACDNYQFNSTNLKNLPNGGFIYARSNNMTVQFYKFWYKSKETYPGKNEQDVLNIIKFDSFINKIGLKIKFLDTDYFGGFCQPSKDLNVVCTMHANCCTSLDKKIRDLHMLVDEWNKYMASPRNRTNVKSWSRRRYCV